MTPNSITINGTTHLFIEGDADCNRCSLCNKCKSWREETPCSLFDNRGYFIDKSKK